MNSIGVQCRHKVKRKATVGRQKSVVCDLERKPYRFGVLGGAWEHRSRCRTSSVPFATSVSCIMMNSNFIYYIYIYTYICMLFCCGVDRVRYRWGFGGDRGLWQGTCIYVYRYIYSMWWYRYICIYIHIHIDIYRSFIFAFWPQRRRVLCHWLCADIYMDVLLWWIRTNLLNTYISVLTSSLSETL